ERGWQAAQGSQGPPDGRRHPRGCPDDRQPRKRLLQGEAEEEGQAARDCDQARLSGRLRSAEGAMKPPPVAKPAPRPSLTRRFWRVFEYRRPEPIRRPRFTT